MKRMCPYCKQLKKGVGPKIVGRDKTNIYTKIMCNDCYKLYQRGKLEVV